MTDFTHPPQNMRNPGEVLAAYLREKGVPPRRAAELIGVPHGTFQALLKGYHPFTPRLALLVGRLTGTSASLWAYSWTFWQLAKAYGQAGGTDLVDLLSDLTPHYESAREAGDHHRLARQLWPEGPPKVFKASYPKTTTKAEEIPS